MKKLLSIFLLLTICSQFVIKIGVVVCWKFNQDYIAKNLCINRNKPELGCYGKCCLEKELKQVENEGHPNNASLPSKFKAFEIDNFVTNGEVNFPILFHSQKIIQITVFSNLYSFDYINSCFHPPQV